MDLENIVVSLAKNKSEDAQGNLIKMVGGHSNHVWRYKGAQEIVLKKYLKVPQGSGSGAQVQGEMCQLCLKCVNMM